MKRIIAFTLGLASGVFFLASCEGDYETAEYKVVEKAKEEGIEIRDYSELIMVAAPMNEEKRAGQNKSFRKLFRYISKGNVNEQKIAMTTPVFATPADEKAGEEAKMYFVLPKEMKLKDVPKPKDKDLEVIKQKKGKYAVYRYSGKSDFEDREKHQKKLMEWMEKKGLKAKGEVIWAGYDPPWTPGPMRRNEVLVRVEAKK